MASTSSTSYTVQATSSTSSTSNIKLISKALTNYANITGIDLSKNPFAAAIKHANSSESILELLQEREKAFKEYREGNQSLISSLRPAVNAIQAFSRILGEALVPFPLAKALFVGIDVLLSTASEVTSSYDALLDLFESLGHFLKRLEVYTTIPPTSMMIGPITKIMVELLSVLAMATKQIKQGRFSKEIREEVVGERQESGRP
ncbi:hypothetical protein BGY98DRAFT_167224 [Russula aff. rugulosa BPL654]|nr:hypothetical protein BGY98DRAFT_167224 [Russula aff. rugulosa BPL654]